MGQKVNPRVMRIGINGKDWDSVFCESKYAYAESIKKDFLIRSYVDKHFKAAKISELRVEKISNSYKLTIFAAKLSALTGKNMEIVEDLKKYITRVTNADAVIINFSEVKKPDTDAKLVAMSIAKQIETRANPKRAMKRAAQLATKSGGVKGVKVEISGRLGGVEIARSEKFHSGRIPLHTLSADIDYAHEEAKTVYGMIGVKVWICKGLKLAV